MYESTLTRCPVTSDKVWEGKEKKKEKDTNSALVIQTTIFKTVLVFHLSTVPS